MNLCLGCMKKIMEDDIYCPFCGHTVGTTAENALREGTILENRYVVGKMLANNILQTTYLGWDAEEERKVIIKEVFPRMFSSRGDAGEIVVSQEHTEDYLHALQSFSDEYGVQQRFRGMGCIADVEAVIKANNTIYAVIEFIEGTTLEETFREHTVTFDSAINVIIGLAKTLSPLHKVGVAHCNICPSNVMITADGRVKLLDFGSAKYKMGLGRSALAGILKTGYAPAELSSAKTGISAKADVYSLAAVLYKMLTGITPPSATERMENDTLRDPSAVSKTKISNGAENAILNALAVYPDQRTESVDAFLAQLQNDETQRIITAPKDRSGGKVPLWLKIAAPILGVALVIFLAVFVLPNNKLSLSSFISRDPQVPNVINKTEEEAKASIEGASLTMHIVGQQHDDKIEAGRVLTQTPAGGALLAKEGTVEIRMSAGPKPPSNEMPYVAYMTEEEAKALLAELGVTAEVIYEYSDSTKKGLVMRQSIAQGTALEENTTVTLTVSLGRRPSDKKKNNQTSTGNVTPSTSATPTDASTETSAQTTATPTDASTETSAPQTSASTSTSGQTETGAGEQSTFTPPRPGVVR